MTIWNPIAAVIALCLYSAGVALILRVMLLGRDPSHDEGDDARGDDEKNLNHGERF